MVDIGSGLGVVGAMADMGQVQGEVLRRPGGKNVVQVEVAHPVVRLPCSGTEAPVSVVNRL